jgi:hypothetical protein
MLNISSYYTGINSNMFWARSTLIHSVRAACYGLDKIPWYLLFLSDGCPLTPILHLKVFLQLILLMCDAGEFAAVRLSAASTAASGAEWPVNPTWLGNRIKQVWILRRDNGRRGQTFYYQYVCEVSIQDGSPTRHRTRKLPLTDCAVSSIASRVAWGFAMKMDEVSNSRLTRTLINRDRPEMSLAHLQETDAGLSSDFRFSLCCHLPAKTFSSPFANVLVFTAYWRL